MGALRNRPSSNLIGRAGQTQSFGLVSSASVTIGASGSQGAGGAIVTVNPALNEDVALHSFLISTATGNVAWYLNTFGAGDVLQAQCLFSTISTVSPQQAVPIPLARIPAGTALRVSVANLTNASAFTVTGHFIYVRLAALEAN